MIVGALQNRSSDAPVELLSELNSVLASRSQGGFTTCSCALIDTHGSLIIANAGHLAPYRNGEEVAVPPGLPLGIDSDAHWTDLRIKLEPGDRVLWVSDGVIQARNCKADLLGFQRAQELSTRSASEIARVAQQFGQEDDITVVSVTRQPVPVYTRRKLAILSSLVLGAFAADAISNATSGPWIAELNGALGAGRREMIRIGPPPGLKMIRNGRSCRRLAGHRKPPVFTGFVFTSEQGQSDHLWLPTPRLRFPDSYELYWDGERIGNFGLPAPDGQPSGTWFCAALADISVYPAV